MKPIVKQNNRKTAFTIVELLTVMSIIIILMGLLAPAMNRVRRYARLVSQKNQFHSINIALEMFRAEFDGYPDSGPMDTATPPQPYCGAMKLAEAMMGQDLLGFHPDSRFRADGQDGSGNPLYYYPGPPPLGNLKSRKEHYLSLENAKAYQLKNIYSTPAPFNGDRFVLCDVYTRATNLSTGKRIGMPILYYKAYTTLSAHDLANANNPQNIYKYQDNDELVRLGLPWNPTAAHPMASTGTTPDNVAADPTIFYRETWNEKITSIRRPYRLDSFILISAGFDGQYGTPDDVFNFEKD